MENRRHQTGTSLDPIILDDDEDDFNDVDIVTHAQTPTLAQVRQPSTSGGPSSGISSSKIASKDISPVGSSEWMQTHTAGRDESQNACPVDSSISVRRKDASVQEGGKRDLEPLVAVTETDHKIQANRANTDTGTAMPNLKRLPESNEKRQMDLSAEKILQQSRHLLNEETDSLSEAEIESCLLNHLALLHETHAVMVKSALKKARMSLSSYFPSPAENAQTIDPFADMPSFALGRDRTDEWPDTNTPIEIISFESSAPVIPINRRHLYYSQSVLAENVWKLDAIPYLDDGQHSDESKQSLFRELADQYDVSDIENRSVGALRELRYTFYRSCVEALFEEVGINWELILVWFLSPSGQLLQIFSSFYHSRKRQDEFQECLRDRCECEESEELSKKEWERILAQLPVPSPQDLRTCALVCKLFKKHRFSMWELARQSESAERCLRNTFPNADSAVPSSKGVSTYLEGICGICFVYNCSLHGERTEWPKPRDIQDSASNFEAQDGNREEDEYFDSTIVDQVVNYQQIVNARLHMPSKGASTRFNTKHWLHTGNWEDRENFIPCNHPGTCKDAHCSCFRGRVLCEKTCNCAASCRRRYPGCSCTPNGFELVCGMTTMCECRELNRECDADLCGRCGAAEVLDPLNRYQDEDASRCCNVDIQRGTPKGTLWGQSKIHGIGLFTAEHVKKGDFLGEYTGDLVTVAEADRRGTTYPYQGIEYLFKLNKTQEIDATRAGSLVRFINCAPKKVANCEVRILLCNSVLRIGFFAGRDLPPATELTFDYNYPEHKTQSFVQPEDETSRGHTSTASSSQAATRSDVTRHHLSARKSAGTKMSARSAGRSKVSLSGEKTKRARESGIASNVGLNPLGRVANDMGDSVANTNQVSMQSVQNNSSSVMHKPFKGGCRNDPEEEDDEYMDKSESESEDSYVDAPSSDPDDSDNSEANFKLRPNLGRPLAAETSYARIKASPVQAAAKTTLTAPEGLRARKSAPRQSKHSLSRGRKG